MLLCLAFFMKIKKTMKFAKNKANTKNTDGHQNIKKTENNNPSTPKIKFAMQNRVFLTILFLFDSDFCGRLTTT